MLTAKHPGLDILGYNVGEVERDGDGLDTVTVRCVTLCHHLNNGPATRNYKKNAVTRRSATGAERKWISTSSLTRASESDGDREGGPTRDDHSGGGDYYVGP